MALSSSLRAELRRAWPYASALAILLAAVVTVGGHLSNSFPSQERPFGWPGPSSFENAVAMKRPDILLATTVPALLLGATAVRDRDPRASPVQALLPMLGTDVALLVGASFLGGWIAFLAVSPSPEPAILAFGMAHGLLATSFYSLAFLAAVLVPRLAIPAALLVWGFLLMVYESVTRVVLLRQIGYAGLAARAFPAWFWVSQAFSPLTAYRGVLVLWRKGFRDYEEKAALERATLPGWMVPETFTLLMVVVWIAVPLGLALAAWRWRGRARSEEQATPATRLSRT